MRAASIPARAASAASLQSARLLAVAGDGRLVEQVSRGNDAAFEVLFERHGPAILAFCRHMLGSPEEAEDAVQHTFAAAYRDLHRGGEREIALKPWLFTIARNRCLSLLRARREVPADAGALESGEPASAELAERVEERAELRRLVADVRELPDEQRAALLLTELGDLSHMEVADVLDCEVSRVKGLVHRARSTLIARRDARETPCHSIREQLANLRGGSLRRTELRLHLRECPGCRAYRDKVKQQRRMLAAALPVAPALGLKSSVFAAIGIGAGSAGGLTAAGSLGGATVAKVAVAGVLAGGGMVAGDAIVDSERQVAVPPAPSHAAGGNGAPAADRDGSAPAGAGADVGAGRPTSAGGGPTSATAAPASAVGRAVPGAERMSGGEGRAPARPARQRGRGPIDAPPANTSVTRGPPDNAPKSEPGTNAEPRGLAKGHTKPAPGSRGDNAKQAKGHTKAAPGSRGRGNAKQANGGPPAKEPKLNGGPKTKAKAPSGSTPNGGPKPNSGTKLNSGTDADNTLNPNGGPDPPAGPKPKAETAPPAGTKAKPVTGPPAKTKPDPPGQTP
jgi:RNA polymerase sigma factor (sigma-70 family)